MCQCSGCEGTAVANGLSPSVTQCMEFCLGDGGEKVSISRVEDG